MGLISPLICWAKQVGYLITNIFLLIIRNGINYIEIETISIPFAENFFDFQSAASVWNQPTNNTILDD